MQRIAIVPYMVDVPVKLMSQVVGAIQLQILQHVRPAWDVEATITFYASLDDVPANYAIVFLVADPNGQAGLHFRPEVPEEPPFAIVKYEASSYLWTMALSHEIIEMLVDPAGRTLYPGPDPSNTSRQVLFLAEICDPCQDSIYSYKIADHPNVYLCDFCLPGFYSRKSNVQGYSHTGAILAPFTVAYGGYISWKNSDGQWFQMADGRGIQKISELDAFGGEPPANIRGALDRMKPSYAGPANFNARQTKKSRANESLGEMAIKRNLTLARHLNNLMG